MPAEPLRLLVVCTANQCRSPMAAALARRSMQLADIHAVVASAGVDAHPGIPATEYAELAVARLGLDISDHRSRHIDDVELSAFDMIWCMERRHVVEIGRVDRSAIPATFTLLDLERRAATTHRHPAENTRRWLERVATDRSTGDLLGSSTEDDVADPIGRSLRHYKKCVERMNAAINQIIEGINGPLSPRSSEH